MGLCLAVISPELTIFLMTLKPESPISDRNSKEASEANVLGQSDAVMAQSKFIQEVHEIKAQKGGDISPDELRRTAFKALDRMFGMSSSDGGENAGVTAEQKAFRDSYKSGSSDGSIDTMASLDQGVRAASNPLEIFRDAEARALMPMIRNLDQAQTISPADNTPLKEVNGSFFSQKDLERLANGQNVEIELFDKTLPEGGSRRGRRIRLGGSDVDKVVALIGRNEGRADSINWNDAGSGISVGIQQSNQKSGNLPELLHRMKEADPAKFRQIFGRNADNLMDESFVRRAHFAPGNELGRAMQAAVREPAFQRVQVMMVREHVERAAEIAKGLGIQSTMGVALVADLTNQFGEGGALKYLRQARGRHGEEAKVAAIARASEGGHFTRRQRFATIAQSGLVSTQESFNA
jgi:hypothetical protein